LHASGEKIRMKSDVILHALNEYLHIDGIAFYLEISYYEVNGDLIELDRQCCILLSRGAVELKILITVQRGVISKIMRRTILVRGSTLSSQLECSRMDS
jgi:hypothetical protein